MVRLLALNLQIYIGQLFCQGGGSGQFGTGAGFLLPGAVAAGNIRLFTN